MNKVITNCLIGVGAVATVFSLTMLVNHADAGEMYDCRGMGYNDTSCPDGSGVLKCPYDITKLKCMQTCSSAGYTLTSCSDTVGEYVSCQGKCQYTSCKQGASLNPDTGECTISYHSCENAEVGDIYYSDGTCSAGYDGSKTPFGVVFYSHTGDVYIVGLTESAMNLTSNYFDGAAEYGFGEYYSTANAAKQDTDAYDKNDTYNAFGGTGGAIDYCENYINYHEDFYVPGGWELDWLYRGKDVINQALTRAGGTPLGNVNNGMYLSVSDFDEPGEVWQVNMTTGDWSPEDAWTTGTPVGIARCVKQY